MPEVKTKQDRLAAMLEASPAQKGEHEVGHARVHVSIMSYILQQSGFMEMPESLI